MSLRPLLAAPALLALLACSITGDAPAPGADFQRIASVLAHPRCLNCHTNSDFPRQGDERRRHAFNVRRGEDNQGAVAQRCTTCHTDRNNSASGVPGAPHWALAPLSMGWEDRTAREICERMRDPTLNGGRDLDALVRHMTDDALVQWAWAPGGERTSPPLSQEEFHAAVVRWAQAGGRC